MKKEITERIWEKEPERTVKRAAGQDMESGGTERKLY